MILASQVYPGTAWTGAPSAAPSPRRGPQDPTTWFDGHAEPLSVCIGGEVSP